MWPRLFTTARRRLADADEAIMIPHTATRPPVWPRAQRPVFSSPTRPAPTRQRYLIDTAEVEMPGVDRWGVPRDPRGSVLDERITYVAMQDERHRLIEWHILDASTRTLPLAAQALYPALCGRTPPHSVVHNDDKWDVLTWRTWREGYPTDYPNDASLGVCVDCRHLQAGWSQDWQQPTLSARVNATHLDLKPQALRDTLEQTWQRVAREIVALDQLVGRQAAYREALSAPERQRVRHALTLLAAAYDLMRADEDQP